MSQFRSPEGFKNSEANLVGRQIIAAGGGPDDIEVVAFVDITNIGSGATKVANLPSAADLLGKGPMFIAVDAGVATEDVDITPQAGETLNGVAGAVNVTAPGTYFVSATSRTDLTIALLT